jgi:hypothetical protein
MANETSETEGTPGPWRLETESRSADGSDLVVTDAIGAYTVATCRIGDTGVADVYEAEANARLIAAAPEMAAALRKIVALNGSTGGLKSLVAEFKHWAEQALAKAEGR